MAFETLDLARIHEQALITLEMLPGNYQEGKILL